MNFMFRKISPILLVVVSVISIATFNKANAAVACSGGGAMGTANVTDNSGVGGSTCYATANNDSAATNGYTILKGHAGNAFNAGSYTGITFNNNSGVIGITASGGSAVNSSSGGSITTLSNSGSIGGGSSAISLMGSVGTITNTSSGTIGLITVSGTDYLSGTGISISSTATTIDNSGVITGGTYAVYNGGTIGTITNNSGATIGSSSTINAISNSFGKTITTLTNDGTITGTTSGVNNNSGTITTLTNTGTISGTGGTSYGISNNGSTITTLTNTGTITGTTFGITNISGTIVTLENSQGASSALTYRGKLPTNYNVIVSSPTAYGKLAVTSPTGTMAFGISAGSTVVNGSTYTAVLTGITSASSFSVSSGTFTGGIAWHLEQQGTSGIWDLVMTAASSSSSSSVDLSPNAYAVRSVFNIQSSALNAGLSYDCAVFDKEGLCLSTGARYLGANSPSASTTSALLIGSYKFDKNIRLGAWVDQNLSTNNADGVKLGNSKPLLGVFGVWSERNDGLGYEVKVSAGYGEKDLTVTRTSSNEGSTKVNMKGIQSVSSYGIALDADWITAPYAGLKYVSISRGGYTEGGSSALTYDTLRQETTSVVAGVKFTGKIDAQTFAVLSAGVEHDLNHNVGQYSAGSSNTTAFNSDVKKTRPVASAGVYHDLDKTQRLGLNAVVRQEPFQSTSSTSAMATYTVGF